jgi:hypothetical protein
LYQTKIYNFNIFITFIARPVLKRFHDIAKQLSPLPQSFKFYTIKVVENEKM